MTAQTYQGWAIVEIMGHRRRAGLVVMDESPTIRIDMPLPRPEDAPEDAPAEVLTEFYGRGAIFSLRPCTEEVARATVAEIVRWDGDPRPQIPAAHPPVAALGFRPRDDGPGADDFEADGLDD